ncbi:polysaccharide biosynthesis tyrosine autokinase [Pseudonocardia sp.]|uniref:polysaccharide biosynthesis tyrosine autokinase n=1 Tax=Pseudonocardia sp. TaxID=60912 RepID=UPI003D0C6F6E
MAPSEYLRVLRERKLIVLVCLLIGMIGGAAYGLLSSPQYTATTSLYVSSRNVSALDEAYQGGLLAQQKAKVYSQLILDDRVRRDVQASVGTPVASSQISVSLDTDSPVLQVSTTASTPALAERMATAVGEVFIRLVNGLEQEAATEDAPSSPVTVQVLQSPELPSSEASPRMVTNIGLGLVAGLILGFATALIAHVVDRSVRTIEALEDLDGGPVLGVIPFDRSLREYPIFMHERPRGPLAESFRQLRTNLRAAVGGDARTFLVTSALPVEGRTAIVCNLAIAFGLERRRVVIVDADLRESRVADYLGMPNDQGLVGVLQRSCAPAAAVQPWDGVPGVDVLVSGPEISNPSEMLASQIMQELLGDLARRYDVVLVDAPPIVPFTDAAVLSPHCDATILVTRYGKTPVEDAGEAVRALAAVSGNLVGFVLDMAPAGARRRAARTVRNADTVDRAPDDRVRDEAEPAADQQVAVPVGARPDLRKAPRQDERDHATTNGAAVSLTDAIRADESATVKNEAVTPSGPVSTELAPPRPRDLTPDSATPNHATRRSTGSEPGAATEPEAPQPSSVSRPARPKPGRQKTARTIPDSPGPAEPAASATETTTGEPTSGDDGAKGEVANADVEATVKLRAAASEPDLFRPAPKPPSPKPRHPAGRP